MNETTSLIDLIVRWGLFGLPVVVGLVVLLLAISIADRHPRRGPPPAEKKEPPTDRP